MHRRTTLISSPEHSAKTKNREYWQEVQTLIGFLNQQKRIKAINEAIHVSGTGVWSVTPARRRTSRISLDIWLVEYAGQQYIGATFLVQVGAHL